MTDQMILSIRRPDDWHVHLRDNAVMRSVVVVGAAVAVVG